MKHTIYMLLCVAAAVFFAACTQEEVPIFEKGSDGIYFSGGANARMDTTINFANHVLNDGDIVYVPLRLSVLGFVNVGHDRRAVLKQKTIDGYQPATVILPDVIVADGESEITISVGISKPKQLDSVYAVCLYFDADDKSSDFGKGIVEHSEYKLYVTEHYERPSSWSTTLGLYLGAWDVDKHRFMIRLLQNDHYAETNNWGELAQFNQLAVDSARAYNQAHPQEPLTFGFPFVEYVNYTRPPYYWSDLHDKYLGRYSSSAFITMTNKMNITTLNEEEVFRADPATLESLNKTAVESMMKAYNEYYYWYYMTTQDYEKQLNVPIIATTEYSIEAPLMWTEQVTGDIVRSYYGDYSPDKYRFILRTLAAELGSGFSLARLFPIVAYYDFNGILKAQLDEAVDGAELMEQYSQIVRTEYNKNPSAYDFTFPQP